jgi:hypothetical protein
MAKTAKIKKPYIRRIKDHDNFVRGILSINALVLKLLLHYIPKKIQPYMDFSTLKALTDMQINNKLKLIQADSIHECALISDTFPQHILDKDKLPIFRFYFLWETKAADPMNLLKLKLSLIDTDLSAMT